MGESSALGWVRVKSGKIEMLILLLVAGAVTYLYTPFLDQVLSGKRSSAESSTSQGRNPASVGSGPEWLTSTTAQGVYEQLRSEDQVRVRRAVQYFCAINWDTDSCIHHMITCGKTCMTYLNEETQARVRVAFFKRLAEMERGN